jgi:phosphatidylserine/phosphatidylglycerophosphate/cardiolipin synthase-like enzyme
MDARFLQGDALYREVVLDKLAHARESVWISTANVKAMYVEQDGEFRPVLDLFAKLAARGVELRLLHAELPSRPFRTAFDRQAALVRGGLQLKLCPRVHFKCVLVDGAWVYLGSANLTGAGLGAKDPRRRNFEVGFVTEDFDVVDRTCALFEAVWRGDECRHCKLREVCPDPIGEAAPRSRGRAGSRPGKGGVELGRARRLKLPGR